MLTVLPNSRYLLPLVFLVIGDSANDRAGPDGRAEDGGGQEDVLHLRRAHVRAAGTAGLP